MPQRKLGPIVMAGLMGVALGLPAQAQKTNPKPTVGALWTSQFGGDVRVLFAGATLPASGLNRAPYRDSRDSAICVAPEALAVLGIAATIEGSSVKLVDADRNLVMVMARQGPFERSGGVFVDIVEVLKTMGVAALSYTTESSTLTLRSVLREVTLNGGTLKISSGLPLTPKLTVESQGLRVLVDLEGATVGELPQMLPVGGSKFLAVRALQVEENLARLVIDLAEPLPLAWSEGKPGARLTLALPGVPPATPSTPPTPSIRRPVTTVVPPTKNTKPSPKIPTLALKAVRATPVSESRLRFNLETGRLPAVRPMLQKETLTLDFGNVYLAESALAGAGGLAELKHPLIKSAQLVGVGASAARLLVELASNVGYTIRHTKGGGVLLELLAPKVTEGPLVGKTIVVDPGHGGSSSPGNRGTDGVYERNLTLPMSLALAQALEEMGANVILTRESDFDPGLYERAYIANRAAADLFVSVHCNDGVSNHRVRGTEVYYHASEPVSRDVAKFISDRMRQSAGSIPVRGALSDYRIYPGDGFAVLRNSQMAGVLVEAGYMSNGADYTALKNKNTQTKLGISIAQGIADFFAANPGSVAMRYTKPQPLRDYGFPPPLALPDDITVESPIK